VLPFELTCRLVANAILYRPAREAEKGVCWRDCEPCSFTADRTRFEFLVRKPVMWVEVGHRKVRD
jgi:hypothetical protein